MLQRLFSLFLLFNFVLAGRFAVLSDIHYDQKYSVGSPDHCIIGSKSGMGCCRSWDIALQPSSPAPENGTIGCDSPVTLVNITIQWLKNMNLDYLIFLGDIVDHDLLIQNPRYNLEEISTVANLFQQLNIPTYSVFGNHDGPIIDNLWTTTEGYEWIKEVANIYKLPSSFLTGGYYNLTNNENVRMIFLNCLGYDTHNIEVDLEPNKDLFGQTAWLLDQISTAQKLNETVYLFSHFGSDTGEASNKYNWLISHLNYSNIVYFAGHSHHDEIRVFGNDIFYINPSLIPDEHYPEVRIYETQDKILLNYEQYGYNFTSNELTLVYSAKESYQMEDISTKSWLNFINRMTTNKTLSQLYCNHYYWGYWNYTC
jgi:predicted phosphodiesterase